MRYTISFRIRTDRFTMFMAALAFSLGLSVFAFPAQFLTSFFAGLAPYSRPFASLMLAGGALLFLQLRYELPPAWQRALHLIPAGGFWWLAVYFARINYWPFVVAVAPLGAGVALAPWLSAPGPTARRELDLWKAAVGAIVIAMGGLMIWRPSAYALPGYAGLQPHLWWVGWLGVLGGSGLLIPMDTASPRRAALVWLLGGSFMGVYGYFLMASQFWAGAINVLVWLAMPLALQIRILPPARLPRRPTLPAFAAGGNSAMPSSMAQELHSWILVIVLVIAAGVPSGTAVRSPLAAHLFVTVAVACNLCLNWLLAPMIPAEWRSLWHALVHIIALSFLFADGGRITDALVISMLVMAVGLVQSSTARNARVALGVATAAYAVGELFHWFSGEEALVEAAVKAAFLAMVLVPVGELAIRTMQSQQRALRALTAARGRLQRQLDQRSMLVQIAAAIHSSLELGQMLPKTVAALGKLMKADQTFVFLKADPASQPGLYLWAGDAVQSLGQQPPELVRTVEPLWGAGDVIRIDDLSKPPGRDILSDAQIALAQSRGIRALLLCPLEVDGKPVGAIGCSNGPDPRRWLPEETDFVRAVALQVGVAVAHATAHRSLAYAAHHDALTGLLNRRQFRAELDAELGRASATGAHGALLFLDLDQFKYLNDTLGHQAGDELLVSLSAMLRAIVEPPNTLARIGGDEFAILMPDATESEARELAERVRTEVHSHPFIIGGRAVSSGVSIGVSLYPEHGCVAEALLTRADLALYAAKELGRNQHRVYSATQDQQQEMQAQLTWEQRIRGALQAGRFVAYSQPILCLETNQVSGLELLVRMRDGAGGVVPPGAFLDAAERSGLIVEIDFWMVTQAIEQIARHERAGAPLSVHVNLSARTLTAPGLPGHIRAEIERMGISPRLLVLEITETAVVTSMQRALECMEPLRALGCRFALDDFGSGFSSFSHLLSLPLDCLKLDGRFVRDLRGNPRNQAFVRAAAEMAASLGMEVVAEYVEEAAVADVLRQFRVGHAQGYWVGRPEPIGASALAKKS